MAFVRRTLSSRAMRIHLALFVVLGIGFAVLDWAQGVDSSNTVLGLDWAHVLLVVWFPILATHAVVSWFGSEYVDSLDRKELGRMYGSWFTGGHRR